MAFTKMLWVSSSPIPVVASWDYWLSSSITQFVKIWNYTYNKWNAGISYHAVAYVLNGDNLGVLPFLISPSANATEFHRSYGSSRTYTSQGSVTDINNITWYFAYPQGYSGDYVSSENLVIPSDFIINTKQTPYAYSVAGYEQATQYLLDGIYAFGFETNFQVGQTYTLHATSIQRTIRKLVSTALHRHISVYSTNPAYAAFSDNADTIINNVMTSITNKGDQNGIVNVDVMIDDTVGDTFVRLEVSHGTTNEYGQNVDYVSNVTVSSKTTTYHYDTYTFQDSITYDWMEEVTVDHSGTITYNTLSGDTRTIIAGMNPYTRYGSPAYSLTNLGVNL